MNFFIGGEHFYSPQMLFKEKLFHLDNYICNRFESKHIYYTGGGIHSLHLILRNLNFLKDEYCLLPSYLCPTILYPFNDLNIKYKFYKVDQNLNIDLSFFNNSINSKCKAVFFINYFGFSHSDVTINYLQQLKKKGIIIIEDAAQSFFSDFTSVIGDFCFNSFRKFLPMDASVIISNLPLNSGRLKKYSKYTFYKNLGQLFRYFNYKTGIGFSKTFQSFFKKAENEYYKNFSKGFDRYNKYFLERTNFEKLIKKRRDYFSILLKEFEGISFFKELPDGVTPLGFPIIYEKRDELKKYLIKESIFCPVHWKLPEEITRINFPESITLSNKLFTLPINENITEENFSKYIFILKKYLK
jgi:dTDP-4-amino-4,6-dideoxygalactose transaminase